MPEQATTHERRVMAGALDARAEGESRTLAGYAAVFNEETVIGNWFREVILPGAFAEAIGRDDVRAQFNHGDGGVLPLGRTSSKTLRLSEDARGLRYEIDLPATTQAADLWVSVQRGDVAESSFMFEIEKSDDEVWDETGAKQGLLPLRQIKRVKLYDVSPVVFPAYSGTTVSARAWAMKDAKPPAPPSDGQAEHILALLALDEVEG